MFSVVKDFLAHSGTKKLFLVLGALLLFAGALQFVQAQEPQNKIVVETIKWCGKSYTPQEWQDVKSGYWNGKCPESVE